MTDQYRDSASARPSPKRTRHGTQTTLLISPAESSFDRSCPHLAGRCNVVDAPRGWSQPLLHMMEDASPEQLEPRTYRRFQLFAWGFLGGYMLLYVVANPRLWQWPPILLELGRVTVFLAMSHAIVRTALARRWLALQRSHLLRNGLIACSIAGLAITLAFYPLAQVAYPATDFPLATYGALWPLIDYISNTGILIMWGGFFLVFYFHDLSRKAEIDRIKIVAASKESQLSTLKNQLNSHFLFNSFNLLRSLVQRDPQAARESITHLSEMMRHSLSISTRNTITIASEVAFVEAYLALERLRYEERLNLHADIPPELRSYEIPSMLLHTFVDNAVKYGVVQSIAGVSVSYSIRLLSDNTLHLCVKNNGRLAETSDSTSTGLANIQRRLAILYGNSASLHVQERSGHVIAEASWPASVKASVG